jgi:16S rRNA (guanine1516-N2)-methyltransferase
MQSVVPLLVTPEYVTQSAALQQRFELPIVTQLDENIDLYLQFQAGSLGLCQQYSLLNPVCVDFLHGRVAFRHRQQEGRRQPLARAIGFAKNPQPVVVDATAGLGRDAFVLASLGAQVIMVERSPVIAALLSDGLQRAIVGTLNQSEQVHLATLFAQHLQLYYGDARDYFATLFRKYPQAVLYLDPMYPHREKSALVKKEMRLFRLVVGDDADSADLLTQALQFGVQRIVVKRPKLADGLISQSPTMQIVSEQTRYDVYLNAN